MINLTKKTVEQIRRHAEEAAPNESCGLIVMAGRKQIYVACENTAENPAETFEISADEWLAAAEMGEIVAVAHSHPNGEPFLSGADRQMQIGSGVDWVLVVGSEVKIFRCCPHLRGRLFDYGKADCGTLVRDAFMLAGIDLPDHARTEMDADAAAGYWEKHLEAIGFKRVPDIADLQPGDVVLTALGGQANHAAFYLGHGEILHHAYNHLSRREPYNGYWRDCTHSIWRCPDWQPEMIRAVENDLAFST